MQPASQVYDEAIEAEVIGILKNMTSDWDTGFSGEIQANTRLVADLCCESIDMVQFVVALEETFKRRDLPIEKLLMVDGRYVDDLSVRQVVTFLSTYLG
jgi:acyl carrier protein